MNRRFGPLLVVLAMPLVASALGLVARGQWDARWSTGLRREFVVHGQQANDRVMQRYSLAALCSDARTAARVPPCRTYNRFSAVILAAAATAGMGLLLLGGIAAAGARARRSRKAVMAGFRPVVYGVTVSLVLLLLAHALLGIQVAQLLAIVVGWPGAAILGFIGVAAFLLVIATSAAAIRLARSLTRERPLFGIRIDAFAARRVFPGGTMPSGTHEFHPRHVVVGFVPEVFVSSRGAAWLDGRLDGRSLHVSLTLAQIMTAAQFQATVCHALHRAGRHKGAAARLDEAWIGATAELEDLRSSRGLRRVVALPVLWVLTLLLDAYRDAHAALEREEELASDRAAADAFGPAVYGAGLLKAVAFGPAWTAAVRAMADAAASGTQYPNARLLFAEIVAANTGQAHVAAALHPDAATPRSSVPLRQRLERLGVVPEDLVAYALDVQPDDPAIALIDWDLTALEERLTTVAHLQLLHAGQG